MKRRNQRNQLVWKQSWLIGPVTLLALAGCEQQQNYPAQAYAPSPYALTPYTPVQVQTGGVQTLAVQNTAAAPVAATDPDANNPTIQLPFPAITDELVTAPAEPTTQLQPATDQPIVTEPLVQSPDQNPALPQQVVIVPQPYPVPEPYPVYVPQPVYVPSPYLPSPYIDPYYQPYGLYPIGLYSGTTYGPYGFQTPLSNGPTYYWDGFAWCIDPFWHFQRPPIVVFAPSVIYPLRPFRPVVNPLVATPGPVGRPVMPPAVSPRPVSASLAALKVPRSAGPIASGRPAFSPLPNGQPPTLRGNSARGNANVARPVASPAPAAQLAGQPTGSTPVTSGVPLQRPLPAGAARPGASAVATPAFAGRGPTLARPTATPRPAGPAQPVPGAANYAAVQSLVPVYTSGVPVYTTGARGGPVAIPAAAPVGGNPYLGMSPNGIVRPGAGPTLVAPSMGGFAGPAQPLSSVSVPVQVSGPTDGGGTAGYIPGPGGGYGGGYNGGGGMPRGTANTAPPAINTMPPMINTMPPMMSPGPMGGGAVRVAR